MKGWRKTNTKPKPPHMVFAMWIVHMYISIWKCIVRSGNISLLLFLHNSSFEYVEKLHLCRHTHTNSQFYPLIPKCCAHLSVFLIFHLVSRAAELVCWGCFLKRTWHYENDGGKGMMKKVKHKCVLFMPDTFAIHFCSLLAHNYKDICAYIFSLENFSVFIFLKNPHCHTIYTYRRRLRLSHPQQPKYQNWN